MTLRAHQLTEKEIRRGEENHEVEMMGVWVDQYNNLCDLYPKTAAALKEIAIIKREIYLHYMETAIKLNSNRYATGIPSSLHNSGDQIIQTPTSD